MAKIADKSVKSFDGTSLFYRINKSGRQCVVFLHGLGLNYTCFRKEQEYFVKKGYSTINMDMRGHGISYGADNFSLEAFAKDINEIIKTESISKIILVGHSFGGMVALQFYKMHPKKVDGIILVDSSYKLSLVTVRPSFLVFGFLPCRILNLIGWAMHKKVPSYDFTKCKHVYQIIYASSFVVSNPAMKSCIKSMRSSDLLTSLVKIDVPVLIIETKKDEIFSKLSYHILHKRIKQSQLDVIKGNHEIPLFNPEFLDREIEKYIKSKLVP
ncbi:MAG: alpha/beta hydrolase [Nanoarchaeota archaeon]